MAAARAGAVHKEFSEVAETDRVPSSSLGLRTHLEPLSGPAPVTPRKGKKERRRRSLKQFVQLSPAPSVTIVVCRQRRRSPGPIRSGTLLITAGHGRSLPESGIHDEYPQLDLDVGCGHVAKKVNGGGTHSGLYADKKAGEHEKDGRRCSAQSGVPELH